MSTWCHTSITFDCVLDQFKDICYLLFDIHDGTIMTENMLMSNAKLNASNITKEKTDFGISESKLHYVALCDKYTKNIPEVDIKIGDDAIRDLILKIDNGIISSITYEDDDGVTIELLDDIIYNFEIYYNTIGWYPEWLIPIALANLINVDFYFYHSADTEIGGNLWQIKNHDLYAYIPYVENYVEDKDGNLIEIRFERSEPILVNGWQYWIDKGFISRR